MAPSCQKPQNAWGCLSSYKCWSHFPVVYVLINQVSDSTQSVSLPISQERHFRVSNVTQHRRTYHGIVRHKSVSWTLLPLKSVGGFYFKMAQFKVRVNDWWIEVISTDWRTVSLKIATRKTHSPRPIKIQLMWWVDLTPSQPDLIQ